MTMKEDIKERWVAALTSGEFTQGYGLLSDGERFCCLGVLCELAARDGLIEKWNGLDSINVFYGVPYEDISDLELPEKVMIWAGLTATDPEVQIPGLDLEGSSRLSSLNDNDTPFVEIAELIKENL